MIHDLSKRGFSFTKYLLTWGAFFRLASIMCLILTVISCASTKPKRINPALLQAVKSGDIQQVKKLLEQGSDPNMTDSNGRPLITSITSSPIILTLHASRMDGGSQTINKYKNHTGIVMLLVKYGADVNAKDKDEGTPLLQAKASEEKELVSFLESSGAK